MRPPVIGMNQDFSFFEQGIDLIARQLPGMPQDRVVLNRLFFFVFSELDEVYNRHLAEFGLNSSSFLALAMLLSSEDNRLNPSHLSGALIASPTNVTRLTDELVNAGWVGRKPSTEDRRRVDLSLTKAGHKLILKVLPVIWKLIEQQWADFSPAEVAEFDRLLRKMLAGLSQFREPS
ncbi:MAG: MarR family transcriptional regulator [Thiobacillaceae bacterium]|jgi:MarR family transcriptional repressor of emrRAB